MKTKFFLKARLHVYVVIAALFFVTNSLAQEVKGKTYNFINPEVVNNINDYENAFLTANMTKFRFANKSNIIEFESGLKVELFSGNKLAANGYTVDKAKLLVTEPSNKQRYYFTISTNAKYILQRFTAKELKKQ